MLKWWKAGVAATAAAFFLAACGGGSSNPGNIAEVAERNGFTALLAAVEKADLGGPLTDPLGSLTVFAPTDEAFNALATTLGFADAVAMVDALPAEALANVLLYHVVEGRISSADLVAAGDGTAETLYSFESAPATFDFDTVGGVTITDHLLTTANVVTADVLANNGTIHVIDKVLVPPGIFNVVQMAQLNPAFSTLVTAVVTADLAGTLSGTGPFTVFAPTNDAFAALGSTVQTLLEEVPPTTLTNVLLYHVVGATVLSTDITFGAPVATELTGETFTINADLTITDVGMTNPAPAIVATDIRASNGVIHVINGVLIPLPPVM